MIQGLVTFPAKLFFRHFCMSRCYYYYNFPVLVTYRKSKMSQGIFNRPRMAKVGDALKSHNTRSGTLNVVNSFSILKTVNQSEV